eukprot:c52269_g1_i1 orf=53-322(+)
MPSIFLPYASSLIPTSAKGALVATLVLEKSLEENDPGSSRTVSQQHLFSKQKSGTKHKRIPIHIPFCSSMLSVTKSSPNSLFPSFCLRR